MCSACSASADMRGCAGSLRKLELNGNALQALPGGVGALSALTQLTLQGNRLTSLPEELGDLQVGQRAAHSSGFRV